MKIFYHISMSIAVLMLGFASPQLLAQNKTLFDDDTSRKVRLSEEMKSRASELSSIVARNIGFDVNRAKVDNTRIIMNTNSSGTADAGDQIVEWWLNGELVAVGCHDESAGESYPGPCD